VISEQFSVKTKAGAIAPAFVVYLRRVR